MTATTKTKKTKGTTKKTKGTTKKKDTTPQQLKSQSLNQSKSSSEKSQNNAQDRFIVLLEQLKTAPVQPVSIHDIDADQDFQVRKDSNRMKGGNFAGGLWMGNVSSIQVSHYKNIYADDKDELPPIILGKFEDQKAPPYFIIDGFHRVHAYRHCIEEGKADWIYWQSATVKEKYKKGYDLMNAKIITIKNKEEGRYIAYHLNSQHGVPLTKTEKRERILQYVDAKLYLDENGKLKSLNAIKTDLHASRGAVRLQLERKRPEILEAILKEHPKKAPQPYVIKAPRSEEDKLRDDLTIRRLIEVQQSYRRSGPKKRNDIMTALVALFLEALRIDEWEADGRATMKIEDLSLEDQVIRCEGPYDIAKYVVEARKNHFTGLDCIRYKESCTGLIQAIEDRRKKEKEEELNSDY